jgi:hypothetical protein
MTAHRTTGEEGYRYGEYPYGGGGGYGYDSGASVEGATRDGGYEYRVGAHVEGEAGGGGYGYGGYDYGERYDDKSG